MQRSRTVKIAVVVCTYNRPRLLGHLLRAFELQDYADREMIILDDAGQYRNQRGPGWQLLSVPRRFRSLGEKRNAAAALASADAEAFAIWDDDDLYLPWALSASAAALAQADWSRPSLVLQPQADWSLGQYQTGGLYHAGWAYRRTAFDAAGGYRPLSGPEDQALMHQFEALGVTAADPIALGFRPFYVYAWAEAAGSWGHLSGLGADAWTKLGRYAIDPAELSAVDPPQLNLQTPRILDGIHERPF
jgi:hypothetical protein